MTFNHQTTSDIYNLKSLLLNYSCRLNNEVPGLHQLQVVSSTHSGFLLQIENERQIQLTLVKLPSVLNILMNWLISSSARISNKMLFFCSIIHINEYKF